MARKIWLCGIFALALFLASAIRAFLVDPRGPDPVHVGLALAAATLLCFSQLWFVLYLVLTGRMLRRTLADDTWREPLAISSRSQRMTVPLALASAAGVLGEVALGTWFLTSPTAASLHTVVFWISLVVTLAALWVEHTVARDHERMLREVDARVVTSAALTRPELKSAPGKRFAGRGTTQMDHGSEVLLLCQ